VVGHAGRPHVVKGAWVYTDLSVFTGDEHAVSAYTWRLLSGSEMSTAAAVRPHQYPFDGLAGRSDIQAHTAALRRNLGRGREPGALPVRQRDSAAAGSTPGSSAIGH
jgi:hypothetical protein